MESILNKYKDEFGYIYDIENLYIELKQNNVTKKEIIMILNDIKVNNKNILTMLKKQNIEQKKVIESKKQINSKDYVQEKTVSNKKEATIKTNKRINIEEYIDFINGNIEDDVFLDILPKTNEDISLNIIDTILSYYYGEIVFYEYNLVFDDKEIEELNIYKHIFNKILEYKTNLITITNTEYKNQLIYFMDKDIPNVLKNVEELDDIKSIIKLLESIENGTFTKMKSFTSNEKLKGLFEVRDLKNNTRVIFERLGGGKYVIICSIVDKTNTNSIYKERLYNQIKKYRNCQTSIEMNIEKIKSLVLGDKYE